MVVLQGASMIYVRQRTRRVCGWTYSELAICWDRPDGQTPKRLLRIAIFLIVLVGTYAALEATDVPDHKPTVTLRP